MAKQKTKKEKKDIYKSVLPAIQKKYIIALIACLLSIIMIPEFIEKSFQFPLILVIVLIALATLGLHQGWNFRKLNKKYRPFIMARNLQILSCGLLAGVLVETVPEVVSNTDLLVPYGFFWIIIALIPLQFCGIFSCAHNHKKKYPDRCEFC